MFLDPVTGQQTGGIKKVAYSHEAMAGLILSNPAITQNELAAHFGYTPGWVSQVISSDSFQAFLGERREQIVDPQLRAAVEESFKGLVLQSMEVLRRKLESNPSDELAVEVFKHSSRAMGYGAKVQVSGNVQHTHSHSLIGLLTSIPSTERVVASQEPA